MATTNNDTNKFSEQNIENRISGYNLNKNEHEQIREAVQNRDDNIEKEKNDVRKEWDARVKEEYTKLAKKQKPELKRQLNPPGMRPPNIKSMAIDNVIANHKQRIAKYYNNTDKIIDQILNQAREMGRGLDQQHQPNLKRDFNNAHDHNPG